MINKNILELESVIKGFEYLTSRDEREIVDMEKLREYRTAKEILKQYKYQLSKWQELKECLEKELEVINHDFDCIEPNNLNAKLWNNHCSEFVYELLGEEEE